MYKIEDSEFQLVMELAYLEILRGEAEEQGPAGAPEVLAGLIGERRKRWPDGWPQRMLDDYIKLATNSFDWTGAIGDQPPHPLLAGLRYEFPPRRITPRREKVGVILVHGVGEQKRFEHLDEEIRKLVESLNAMPIYAKINGGKVVVEITPGEQSGFEAEQDIWQIGPKATVRVIAATKFFGEKQFCFHEVWWADVNETYSIAKQIRFWFWGLSVWNYPPKARSANQGADYVFPPATSASKARGVKIKLFFVAVFFTLLGFSIAVIIFILKRLFDMETPKPLQTVTNFVSGVKLYNQRYRRAPSLLPDNDDFLDNIDAAPRYSIRRRMMRALADVALRGYDRWYVLAHSLGSLVAFNGLMETAYTWPGYLDERRWNELMRKQMAGPLASGADPVPAETTPRRPSWSGNDIAYRKRIFEKFQGMLTYGSPLEKFAAIWPARVPIAREPAFRPGVVWVNAMDPVDPVSGVLKSFNSLPEDCCPYPNNIGYRAHWALLYAHLKYLTPKASIFDLPSSTVAWMLGMRHEPGNQLDNGLDGFAYQPGDAEFEWRRLLAYVWWIALFVAMAVLAALIFPTFVKLIVAAVTAGFKEIRENIGL